MVGILINNELLDLDKPEFAITRAANDIAKLESRQGTISTDFEIPNTPNNARILQYSHLPNIVYGSVSPFVKITAKIIQNNLEISSGYIRINGNESNNRVINITFYGDNIDVFNAFKDVRIRDLNLARFDHEYRGNVIAAGDLLNSRTDGYVYGPINYGTKTTASNHRFTTSELLLGSTWNDLNSGRELLPAIFVHTVLEQASYEIGYTIDGNFKSNPLYRKLTMPFSQKYFKNNTDDGSFNVQGTLTSDVPLPAATLVKLFYNNIEGTDYDPVTGKYTAREAILISLNFYTTKSAPLPVEYRIYRNGVFFATLIGIANDDYNSNIMYNDEIAYMKLEAGDYMELYGFSPSGGVTIRSGSYTKIFCDGFVTENGMVNISRCLPDLSAADLLKDLIIRYGIILTTDYNTKTISLNYFAKIKENSYRAIDWSSKIDISKDRETNYTDIVSEYSRVNWLRHKEDENDAALVSYNEANKIPFGDGSIDIDNEFLEGEKEMYESPFAGSVTEQAFIEDGRYAYIMHLPRLVDNVVTSELVPRIAILIDDLFYTNFSSNTIQIATTDGLYEYSNVPYLYFTKPQLGSSLDAFKETLSFGDIEGGLGYGINLIDRYYSDYVRILNAPFVYKPFVRLNEVDMLNLDFSIPLWIEERKRYFYLNKIDGYEANGDSTPVELIAL